MSDPQSGAAAPAPKLQLPTEPHRRHLADVAAQLRVDPESGLAADEVHERRLAHGLNVLPEGAPRGWMRRIADQFRDFMIVVLLIAAVISGAIGDLIDTLAIVAIVVINAAIGVVQEWRADRALQMLKSMAAPQATVRREGSTTVVDAAHLVPGDVVLLEAGDRVPADLRLHHAARLSVDESALTGESVTVQKHTALLPGADLALGDRLNMAFSGTQVTQGRGAGLVVATGARTELGQVAAMLGAAGERRTPLQRRLAAFGQRLAIVVLAICSLIFAIGVLRGEPMLLMALTAISLAVAAIPEALPAVVTVLLALGARRMVDVNALVRRLSSVETLGSVTTICSDKTGTLTLNRMLLREHRLPDGVAAGDLWLACLLCNDAQPGPDDSWIGDPTETALAAAAQAAGVDALAQRQQAGRVHEWPFDSDRMRMTTLHRAGTQWRSLTKGAPETVIPLCAAIGAPGDGLAAAQAAWLDAAAQMAGQGLRVLALAGRDWRESPAGSDADEVEKQLVLIGLVGLIDPPRPEAQAAVAQCRSAGIRPVMITGDHPATALAIARELGIAEPGAQVLTGIEMARLDDAQLQTEVERSAVYARVDPAQKIRIVKALQARGEYVAMTGDGVNDSPALEQADIGVAMGRSGTDVAREASSLVLLDDNFATIVAAVREGRRIFDNIRKFVRYAMTGNSGEIWTLFLAPLLGLPIPLLPVHILWVNLVTDGLPGLALAAEPAERGVMQRPPRPPRESIFAHGLWQHALWIGLLIAALCLGVQAWAWNASNPHGQTMVFTVLTLSQLAHVLAIRSETESLVHQGLASNAVLTLAVALSLAVQLAVIYVPWLQPVFHTQALALSELALCLACAGVVFVAVEIEKAWRRFARTRQAAWA